MEAVVDQPLSVSSLRLVGSKAEEVAAREHQAAAEAVQRANRAAAGMSADDARWVFASRVSESLEGGRAAMLRPERRRRLVDLAQRLGLTHFDASLVIAIVQDSARRGEDMHGPSASPRLVLIPARRRQARTLAPLFPRGGVGNPTIPLFAACAIAIGIVLALIAWVTNA